MLRLVRRFWFGIIVSILVGVCCGVLRHEPSSTTAVEAFTASSPAHHQDQRGREQQGTNRLFLDTAREEDWDDWLPTGIFYGITTNPVLLERADIPCTVASVQHLATRAFSSSSKWRCEEFMCQTWGTTADDMYATGLALASIDRDRIVIKVPVTKLGTIAGRRLREAGVRVCLTACYSSKQAIIACGLGAEYIAPYLGRMQDQQIDGMDECRRMQHIVTGMGSTTTTRVLVASIRDLDSLSDLIRTGQMDTFTINPDLARDLFGHAPLTDRAATDFEAAAQRGGGNTTPRESK